MTRLNLILLLLLIACALGVITAQHRARKLYNELQQERQHAKELDDVLIKLQLEQSTWAMHSRIEKEAASRLDMRVPDAAHTQVIAPGMAEAVPAPVIKE
jgi:cell division protein FtsL